MSDETTLRDLAEAWGRLWAANVKLLEGFSLERSEAYTVEYARWIEERARYEASRGRAIRRDELAFASGRAVCLRPREEAMRVIQALAGPREDSEKSRTPG